MKKVLAILLTVVMLCTVAVGCSQNQPASTPSAGASTGNPPSDTGSQQDNENVTLIAVPTSGQNVVQTAVPLVAGEVMGIWKNLGLDVTRTHYVSGPPQLEANPSGDWEIGWIGATACNTGILQYDMVVLGLSGYDYSNMAFVRDNSDIYLAGDKGVPGTYGTAAEWKGKNIIVGVGTVCYADLMLTLSALGLTEDDVNIINMDISTGLQAFVAGEADVYFTSSSYASELAKRDGFKVIHTMKGMDAGMAGNLIANRSYLEKNEDVVVKYLEGALETIFWLGDEANKDQAAQWYVQVMKEDFGTEMALEDARTNIDQIGFRDISFYEELCKKGDDGLTGLQREYKKFFEYHVQIGSADAANLDKILAACDSTYLEKAIANYKSKHNK